MFDRIELMILRLIVPVLERWFGFEKTSGVRRRIHDLIDFVHGGEKGTYIGIYKDWRGNRIAVYERL